MPPAKQQPQSSMSLPIVVGASIAAVVAAVFGFPSVPIVWIGVFAAAMAEPPPMFTGKKDSSGRPQAAGPGEEAKMRTYRMWQMLRFRLFPFNADMLPGWPIRLPFLWAITAAGAFTLLPTQLASWKYLNALCAYLLVSGVCGARRRTRSNEGDVCPGVRLDTFDDAVRKKTPVMIASIATGAVLAVVSFVVISKSIPAETLVSFQDAATGKVHLGVFKFTGILTRWWSLIAGVAGFLAVASVPWAKVALDPWKDLLAARAQWGPRFEQLKVEPRPTVLSRRRLGAVVIDELQADATLGAAMFVAFNYQPKMRPFINGDHDFYFLDVLARNADGSEIPGSRDSRRFEIAVWPKAQPLDMSGPLSDDEVKFAARLGGLRAMDAIGYGRPVLLEIERANDPELSSALWQSVWAWPDGPGLTQVHLREGSNVRGFDAEFTAIDPNAGGSGVLYIGAEPTAESGVDDALLKRFDELAKEDAWNKRWAEALKLTLSPPGYYPSMCAEFELGPNHTIRSDVFVARQGQDWTETFAKIEPKLSTTLRGAPFVSVVGWPENRNVPGVRHTTAFVVLWSDKQAPATPALLRPPPQPLPAGSTYNFAATAVLKWMMNKAFDAARLPRPEIEVSRCVTANESRRHVWELTLRLYGGVTYSQVRNTRRAISSALQAPYLRIAELGEGQVQIIIGDDWRKLKLSNDRRDRQRLEALDWADAFSECGVSGAGGRLPQLTASQSLPKNPRVRSLLFGLPAGLDTASVREAQKKLATAIGLAYIDVRSSGPSGIEIRCSEEDPLGLMIPLDLEAVKAAKDGVPFASGLSGEPITYSPKDDPHLFIAGMSGGGKAQALTCLLPVPVSRRFPTGWARNADLVEGDEVYTEDGSVTRIVSLSDWSDEYDMYRVTLDDGQTLDVNGPHLWKVSNSVARSTRGPLSNQRRTDRRGRFAMKADAIRSTAAALPIGSFGSAAEGARLIGAHDSALYTFAEEAGIPYRDAEMSCAVQATVTSVRPVAVYDMTHARDALLGLRAGRKIREGGWSETLVDAVVDSGSWLSARAALVAITGVSSWEKNDVRLVRQAFDRLGVPTKTIDQSVMRSRGAALQTVRLYHLNELLMAWADNIEEFGSSANNGRKLQPLEQVVDTATMFASQKASNGSNWAICVAAASGPEATLLVDPYVLGAWLGDGCTSSGTIASGVALSCTDVDGIADQHYMISELTASGYQGHQRATDEVCVGTYGLTTHLRKIGVLGRKHIPAIYRRASFDQRLALLQGLMDTDGTVGEDGGCELSLSDETLANDALELIRSLGIKAFRNIRPASYRDEGGEYVSCTDRHRMKFTTTLPVFRLPRKVARLPQEVRATQEWLYVTKIERIPNEPSRCITVADPSAMYLTEGFVKTHNSVGLQNFVFGSVVRGWKTYIIDPMKGAADFRFAEPYCYGFATSIDSAASLMEYLYAEVARRKNVNATHGVGGYSDLPAEIRPPHIVVIIDEFTSLLQISAVPKVPKGDAEAMATKEEVERENAYRVKIGALAGKIAREARSAGVTIVLATQKLSSKTLESIPGASDLRTNMSRIMLGKATFGDLSAALRAPTEAPKLGEVVPKGRGIWEPGTDRPEAIQVWYTPTTELRTMLDEIAEPVPDSERFVYFEDGDGPTIDAAEWEAPPAASSLWDEGDWGGQSVTPAPVEASPVWSRDVQIPVAPRPPAPLPPPPPGTGMPLPPPVGLPSRTVAKVDTTSMEFDALDDIELVLDDDD